LHGADPSQASARQVLSRLSRWQTWMWANEEIVTLAESLRTHNQTLAPEQQVNFYGMDVYSLWDSMQEVLSYLQRTNPESAAAATAALNCFGPYEREDEFTYAQDKARGQVNCAEELKTLLTKVEEQAAKDNDEAAFNAIQNARVALNAERYYSTAVQSNSASWNVRDEHMAETIDHIISHHGPDTKIIIWAHNTHVGDARATEMEEQGMVNIGQLLREKYGDDNVHATGFGTYSGTVIAARSWGNATTIMNRGATQQL
jgi:erythromycin esterase